MNKMKDINEMGKVTEVKVENNVPDKAVFESTADYDSGWKDDSNSTNHATVFEHGLKVIPSQLMVYFSADKDTVYPLTWSWSANNSGNPVTISMNDRTITLNIVGGFPLHGVWTATNSTWTAYTNGCWRVLAWK